MNSDLGFGGRVNVTSLLAHIPLVVTIHDAFMEARCNITQRTPWQPWPHMTYISSVWGSTKIHQVVKIETDVEHARSQQDADDDNQWW